MYISPQDRTLDVVPDGLYKPSKHLCIQAANCENVLAVISSHKQVNAVQPAV